MYINTSTARPLYYMYCKYSGASFSPFLCGGSVTDEYWCDGGLSSPAALVLCDGFLSDEYWCDGGLSVISPATPALCDVSLIDEYWSDGGLPVL